MDTSRDGSIHPIFELEFGSSCHLELCSLRRVLSLGQSEQSRHINPHLNSTEHPPPTSRLPHTALLHVSFLPNALPAQLQLMLAVPASGSGPVLDDRLGQPAQPAAASAVEEDDLMQAFYKKLTGQWGKHNTKRSRSATQQLDGLGWQAGTQVAE
ncbi:hypothetical protein FN846DRAFT_888871 [Sphaerosporella brunnea]|uniref:Uncharacterized protein n=1 Tax=Sphaerosporella brunnea TaxID=1250544 RepID=A0A5J5F1I4_9PEZI|nr:hypothetical protein FN846DRAFT_888871 [Sphaerosporella brunnea]